MENKRIEVIKTLGRVLPVDMGVIEAARDLKWDRAQIKQAHAAFQAQKVVLQAYQNAVACSQQREVPFLQALCEELQEEQERHILFTRSIVPALKAELTAVLDQAHIPFLFIKGSSLETYPGDYLRQMNDLDFMVRNWDDCFRAARCLTEHGFSHRENLVETPWITLATMEGSQSAGRMIAHLNLTRGQDVEEVSIDLHAFPFMVGPTGVLFHDVWERLKDEYTHIPPPEDKLLILIAHATNHGYVLLKDLNDIYAILHEHGSAFDWDYCGKCIRQSMLAEMAFYCLQRVRTEYNEQHIPASILAELRKQQKGYYTKALALASGRLDDKRQDTAEKVIHTLHTYLFERKQRGGMAGIQMLARYYMVLVRLVLLQSNALGPLKQWSVVQRTLRSKKPCLFPELKRGQQMVILPVTEVSETITEEQIALATNLSIETLLQEYQKQPSQLHIRPIGEQTLAVMYGHAEILVTPLEIYIPTHDGIFTEDVIEDLEHLVAQFFELCHSAVHLVPGPAIGDLR